MHTVLFDMPRDEARAERIRSVLESRKAEDPTWTGRWVSDQLNVSERSVSDWKKKGSISRDNSDRLAELAGVDPVLLWLGRKEQPDLLDVLNGAGPSGQVEDVRDEFRAYVDTMTHKIEQNQRLLQEILAKLVPEELAGATEELADRPAHDAEPRGASARTEGDPGSEQTG